MGFLTLEEIEQNFIDSRNSDLWEYLNKKYQIIVSNIHQYYRLDFITGSDEVYINTTDKYSQPLFTHELLHLKLRELGLNTFDYFERSENKLVEFMISTISNCIEHVLFFDEFIDMGYAKEDFVMDYNNANYDLSQLTFLHKEISALKKPELLSLFIFYAYWTLKNEEYMGVDRDKDLLWLKKSNPLIFAKCERMFDEIIDFDLESASVQKDFNQLMSKYLRRNY